MDDDKYKTNPDLKLLDEAGEKLSEHFDSVHIFATRHEQGSLGGTVNVNVGVGNWFARFGQIREWLIKQDEFARINARDRDK